MAEKTVAVFGASGFLGRYVVRALAERGWRIRAACRRPANANYLRPLGRVGQIDIVQANIRYRQSVRDVTRGVSAVVNLVGILAAEGNQSFAAVQAHGARNIAEEAAAQGITNAVHVSAIGADANSESDYARTKAQGEAAFREFVPAATILRPSILFGPQDDFFNQFAAMAQVSPALPLIGGGKTRFQPVYVADVAECVALAIDETTHDGETFELGGPEVVSFREVLETVLRMTGRNRLLVPIPFPVAGLMGKGGDVANGLPFVSAPITSDQVKLLKNDNVVGISGQDLGTIADFDIEPEAMEAVLPSYLYRYRPKGQFSPETPVGRA